MNTETDIATSPLLTSEVARLLNVSAETVRLWERSGRLQAIRTDSGVRLFDRRDVEQFAREREERRSAAAESRPLVGVA